MSYVRSLGAIMFECLVGYPPFCSESTHETYQKIMSWPQFLMFPDDVHLSEEAEDMIRRSGNFFKHLRIVYIFLIRLVTNAERRLNVDQIKQHNFFYGVDWDTIRTIDARKDSYR